MVHSFVGYSSFIFPFIGLSFWRISNIEIVGLRWIFIFFVENRYLLDILMGGLVNGFREFD